MLSYAGIPLLEPPDSLRAWLAQNADIAELWPFNTQWWPGRNLDHIPFRPPPVPRKVELNALWWPTGAARFAVGWFLVDQPTLDAIRAVIYEDPTETSEGASREDDYFPADLTIDDGYSRVTVEMWMMPPMPLQQTGADGLYLLPLVDERYFWWFRAAAITVGGGVTTWAGLYADIAAALGITLAVDTVEAAYLMPAATLGAQYESLPLLLDAVAYSTGRRIVRGLDGTVRAWNPANSLTQQAASLAAIADKLSGGLMSLGVTGLDETPQVPSSITVTAYRTDSGVLADTVHAEAVTLDALALPEYDGIVGFSGARVVNTSAVALYPGPSNAAEITTLARRIATDWYRWQLARASLALVGYPGWVLTGLDDGVLFRHERGQVFTRVMRATFEVDAPAMPILSSGTGPPPDPNSLTVEEDDLSVIVTQVTTLQFKANEFIVTEVAAGVAHVALGCVTVRPIAGPPPWTAPPDACCNQLFSDGDYIGMRLCPDGWLMLCRCLLDSGSGTGTGSGIGGCLPGICALCNEPPWQWAIVIAGFTGDCTIFNGNWTLANVAACVWKAADIVNGLACTVTLTLAPGTHTLAFSGYTAGGELVTAGYVASTSSLPDCCVPVTFNSDTCSCDIANAPVSCATCATTPQVWNATLAGFTGCYARLNGDWTLAQRRDVPCEWRVVDADVLLDIIVFVNADGTASLLLGDNSLRPSAIANYVTGVLADCCSDAVATLTFHQCEGDGDVPATVTLSPQCSGVGPAGTCPSMLTATPDCCTHHPPPVPTCDCSICPTGAPPRWMFSTYASSGAYADARGPWSLEYVSGCTWMQTRGDVTCTLAADATRRSTLTFTNNVLGSFWVMEDRDAFNCCSANKYFSAARELTPVFGSVDPAIQVLPDGPCTPCEGGQAVACCPGVLLASTIYATFTSETLDPACDEFNTLVVAMTWTGSRWQGHYTVCGKGSTLDLICNLTGWQFNSLPDDPMDGCPFSSLVQSGGACAPFLLSFHGNVNAPCCGSGCAFFVDITE